MATTASGKPADDPLRHGLGLIGAMKPDNWLRPDEWARHVVDLGLVKTVIREADRENDKSRERGIGVVMEPPTPTRLSWWKTDNKKLIRAFGKSGGIA